MKRNYIFIIFGLLILLAGPLFVVTQARAFSMVVHPVEITRGDPFFVVVTGAEEIPTAEFGNEWLPLTPCGEGCFIAIGGSPLGTKAGKHPVKVSHGSLSISLAINVLAGEFERQELTLPKDKVTLSPEDEARADKEAERLRANWAIINPRMWEGDFIMPLEGGISTDFGVVRIMNKTKESIHSGLDIRGAFGTPVYAANAGRVVIDDDLFFGGNSVVIDHGVGIYTVYMHLQESKVLEGKMVSKGEVIGLVGSTGRSTGPHLHYTVKIAATNISPRALSKLPLKKAFAFGEDKGVDEGEDKVAREETEQ